MKNALLALACTSAVAGLGVVSCSSDESGTDIRGEVIDAVVQDLIIPGYEAAGAEADVLAAAALTFCEAPDDDGLAAVQAAWHSTRGAWKRMEVFKFGPVVEFPGRYGSRLDFWPAREDSIEDLLAGDSELTADALADLGTSVRGLPVVEVLAFDETTPETFVDEPRRCAYLVAATQDVSRSFDALVSEWEDPESGWAVQMMEPGADGMYMDDQEVLGELGNRMWFTVENIRAEKLRTPLGDADTSSQPDKVESRFANRAIEDILDNLRGIETLFFGPPPSEMGFDDLLDARGSSTPQRVRTELDASFACLQGLEGPLATTVTSDPDSVETCIDVLADLQRTIQTDVIGELGLSLNFNDADGD